MHSSAITTTPPSAADGSTAIAGAETINVATPTGDDVQVLVGHQPCSCPGGHTTWICHNCAETTYTSPLRSNCRLTQLERTVGHRPKLLLLQSDSHNSIANAKPLLLVVTLLHHGAVAFAGSSLVRRYRADACCI